MPSSRAATIFALFALSGACLAQGKAPPRTFYQGVSISPDGQRIGITATIDGNFDIYSIRVDGTDCRRLTTDSVWDLWEAWSPDSKRLLYSRRNADRTMDLVEMNDDGSGKRVAPNGVGHGGYASWSPDGRRVVFERRVDSAMQVFVMDRDGTNEQRVSRVPSSAENARWSLDGRRIVFETTAPNAPDQLFVVDADGSHQLQITHDTAFSVFPNWTADGRVAFVRGGSLYVVNADGTGERLLRAAVSYAVFSRDGRHMVFLGRAPGTPGGMFAARLWIADADGSNARRVPLPIDP